MGYGDGDVIVYISHSSSYFLIIVFLLFLDLFSFLSLSFPLLFGGKYGQSGFLLVYEY